MDGRTKTGKKKDFRLTHSKENGLQRFMKGEFFSWSEAWFVTKFSIQERYPCVYLEFLIWCMPQALEKNVHTLDLYNQLPNSSSESTSSSSSSSEACTGRPQQLPVEEEKTLPEPVDPAGARANPKGERRKSTRKPSERRCWPGAWTYFVKLFPSLG